MSVARTGRVRKTIETENSFARFWWPITLGEASIPYPAEFRQEIIG